MVGDDDEVGRIAQTASGEARAESFHGGVDVAYRRSGLGRIRAVIMTGMIDHVQIERAKRGPLVSRETQPPQQAVDPLRAGHAAIKRLVVGGPGTGDLGLGAGPEPTSAAHPLFPGGHPYWFTAPPASIDGALRLLVIENRVQRGIVKAVVDDAVMLRAQPRDDGVVVGKCAGGKT